MSDSHIKPRNPWLVCLWAYGLWLVELTGPALLTGGEFGMEISVVSMALMMLVILAALRSGSLRQRGS